MARSKEQRQHAANKLRHFLASVDDLREAREVMRLGTYDATSDSEAEERWRTVLHAMLVRKYFQPDDKLYLTKVVNAVTVLTQELSQTERAALEELKARAVRETSYIDFALGGREAVGEERIHEDALYGRYLHGDFSKWESAVLNVSVEMIAVRFVLSDRVLAVERVAAVVDGLRKEGRLNF